MGTQLPSGNPWRAWTSPNGKPSMNGGFYEAMFDHRRVSLIPKSGIVTSHILWHSVLSTIWQYGFGTWKLWEEQQFWLLMTPHFPYIHIAGYFGLGVNSSFSDKTQMGNIVLFHFYLVIFNNWNTRCFIRFVQGSQPQGALIEFSGRLECAWGRKRLTPIPTKVAPGQKFGPHCMRRWTPRWVIARSFCLQSHGTHVLRTYSWRP